VLPGIYSNEEKTSSTTIDAVTTPLFLIKERRKVEELKEKLQELKDDFKANEKHFLVMKNLAKKDRIKSQD
jgi:hypothetical protein